MRGKDIVKLPFSEPECIHLVERRPLEKEVTKKELQKWLAPVR
jgi:hypothetical protein